MRIIVCIKQVPDPEGPPSSFVVNPELKRVEPRGIPPVLSIFDENALEAALRLKDEMKGDCSISVLTMGGKISDAVMQKALAVGADELIKVEDEKLDAADLDSFCTAEALSKAVRTVGEFDLILVGRQSADWNAGQTGIGIAMLLDIPVITMARKISVRDGLLNVERVIPRGYEVVASKMPAVVMVSNEVGQLRYPTMIQRKEARNKPRIELNAEKINFTGDESRRVIIKNLYAPDLKRRHCTMISATTSEEAGRKLAERLRDDRVL